MSDIWWEWTEVHFKESVIGCARDVCSVCLLKEEEIMNGGIRKLGREKPIEFLTEQPN